MCCLSACIMDDDYRVAEETKVMLIWRISLFSYPWLAAPRGFYKRSQVSGRVQVGYND
jgi:hypothetical protein